MTENIEVTHIYRPLIEGEIVPPNAFVLHLKEGWAVPQHSSEAGKPYLKETKQPEEYAIVVRIKSTVKA